MTKVKICGITNLEDAVRAAACGADMLGFNFYRGSRRFVEPAVVTQIIYETSGFQSVGVFVNATIAEMVSIAETAGLDAIQLHGNEAQELIDDLRTRLPRTEIIKAIRVDDSFVADRVRDHRADRLLLDGDAGSAFGGAGSVFDWSLAQGLSGIILAGGLTVENVGEAIRTARPYAVDVASGVESSPGIKDHAKVAAFIRAAKEAA